LERVLLVPAHTPPHKTPGEDPGPKHRLCMCRLAVEGVAGLSVCAQEIERGGPSYTVDTLKALHASNEDAELTLIVGADIASALPSWREPGTLLELAHLAVAGRDGAERRRVLDAVATLGVDEAAGRRLTERVRFLQMPAIDVSSSAVRSRVEQGMPVEQLVGPSVAAYIAEHGLYRADGEVRP
jgi:nicotinate-nucleotide adenylyltransferase